MTEFDKIDSFVFNRNAKGNVRIWEYSPNKGIGKLILNQSNLITNQGADITARALSGQPNTGITHMYVGYGSGTPTVTASDTITNFPSGFYARIPLQFSPSFANQNGYVNNLVYFTVYVTGSTIPNSSQINQLGLINANNPSNSSADYLFSEIAFSPVTYNSSTGLAITWGLSFTSN